jgi:predicted ATPase
MFDSLSLEHFKSFKRLDKLQLKPITILAGKNSCGKSTILQSLLLLKQTVESKTVNQTIVLNGTHVHLGTLENVLYNHNYDNPLVFEFAFDLAKDRFAQPVNNRDMPIHFVLRQILSEAAFDLPQAKYRFTYHIRLKHKSSAKKSLSTPAILVEQANLAIETIAPSGAVMEATTISAFHDQENIYRVDWNNLNSRFYATTETKPSGSEKLQVLFSNLLPVQISAQSATQNAWPLNFLFHQFSDILRSELNTFSYLGPLREEPSRRYIYEDEILHIGNKGENAAFIFHSEQDKRLSGLFFPDPASGAFIEEKQPMRLLDAIQRWSESLGLTNVKAESEKEIIYLNLDSYANSKTRVNIADVGFGISQIFPIILEGLRMSNSGTLLLEQPEIHLHPKLQMQMADYFISLALSGKRVVVETHSEHIINRLVRRSIENTQQNLNELIGIYFIGQNENGSSYSEVRIDPEYGIINWPSGFFDQGATEQLRIMQEALKHRSSKK